ncbi:MAG: hypothetical protein BGO95_01675 [Micrococcales bacterium 73-13]|nr:MAG: hypothetical protein BGO95_01675 [Micrococcales bacterium 73-13]
MTLTLFMALTGYFKKSWTLPGSRAEELGGFPLFLDVARMAEDAKIDAVFLADALVNDNVVAGNIEFNAFHEPLTTLAATAARTSRIGLVGTLSTTFSEPYNAARMFNSLDHISGGRAGWNVVTSLTGDKNFGMTGMPEAEERYRRAGEFVDVVRELWDSWADDAITADRERGVWLDRDRVHDIEHHGEFFDVVGSLTMGRSPQGHPVLAQAGSSPTGMDLGARIGDLIYTAQPDKAEAIAFYDRIKQMAAGHGRARTDTIVLPGIIAVVGETERDAAELVRMLDSVVDFELGRSTLGKAISIDLSELELDEPIPAERWGEWQDYSRYVMYRRLAEDRGLTLRDLILTNTRSFGHGFVAGTAAQIADRMIDWFESGACDGFNFNPPWIPGGLRNICELLVPELQERGYFHADYEGDTLREHLGLARPGA